MSGEEKRGIEAEFTQKAVITGALRIVMLFASVFAFIVGAVLFALLRPRWIGTLVMLAALGIQAYGIYQSARDSSGFKWPNLIAKALILLLFALTFFGIVHGAA